MRNSWGKLLPLLAVCLLLALTGCGGGPKADVSVFIITQPGPDMEKVEEMEAALQQQLGEKTVDLVVSPIFSMEKLIVEAAAGGHGVFIVNEQPFKAFANQGAFLSLDDTFNPEDYPEGVIEMTVQEDDTERKVTGLYAIPVDRTEWFKAGGYSGETAYAYVPVNAPDPQSAKQALKAIVEWSAQK